MLPSGWGRPPFTLPRGGVIVERMRLGAGAGVCACGLLPLENQWLSLFKPSWTPDG